MLPKAAGATELDAPFPLRNQLVLHLLFLEPAPRAATLVDARSWRFALHLTYESTHAASDDLVRLFRADDFSTYDGRVTQPLLEMVAAGSSGQTAFFFDGETVRAVLEAAIGVGPRFELNLEVPLLLHSGGFLDSVIDEYHERLGLPDGGRTSFQRDRFVAGYVGDGASIFVDRHEGGFGLGDVVLSGRAAIVKEGARRPGVTLSISAKLPTGDPEHLYGSGSADLGAALQISKTIGRSSLHGGYGYARLGDWDLAPGLVLADPQSGFGSYAFSITPRTFLIGQVLRSRGPFEPRSGSDLGEATYEIALGFRHRTRHDLSIEWALLENLNSDSNSPDVGAFFGVGYGTGSRSPRPIARSIPTP